MFEYRPQPKPSHKKVEKLEKVKHKRGKTPQRILGAISPRVRAEVRARSGGICEIRVKCTGAVATEQAHLTGRGVIDHRTTAEDLRDACTACHRWMDSTGDGVKYKKKLREGA